MSAAKTVRLEIRLPESMMDRIREIAPSDGRGRPNISELVRQALQREIRLNSTEAMVDWAKRQSSALGELSSGGK